MIVGIAWIGASFYFVWLDNHLESPKKQSDIDKGVGGEIWSVHGGGFYHAQKYKVSPAKMPANLHWFKWEAYTTWITGMFMLAIIYWYGAEFYLIDASVANLSKPFAIVLSMAVIVQGWIVYDVLCRSPLGKDERVLGGIIFVLLCFTSWGLTELFSGRGAYIHFGAILGTIMVGNVFFVIMPGQRAMVDAASKGEPVDPAHGLRAKQRSVHNTFFTLPVLFVMISNHYAMTYGHEWNWLILVGITLAGGLIRIYFVQRHFAARDTVETGKKVTASPIPLAVAFVILGYVSFVLSAPEKPDLNTVAITEPVTMAQVMPVIQERCSVCHSASPTMAGFASAPAGFLMDSEEQVIKLAQNIHQQSVMTRVMPIGNMTNMTDVERALIDAWYKSLEQK
ncbi:hypothetical protein EOL70_03895 [Leucothrix sargassi]|nr:hypothetical protein EOL70_03895 [Leucothrix sargassi]